MNKEKIYEDNNFVLFKVTEVLRIGAKASYIPVGMIKNNAIDDEYAVVEYYTKEEKYKKLKPKYERGFEFYMHNIMPIEIPENVIMVCTPLRVNEYICIITSIDDFGTEVKYTVDIISDNRKLGTCIMKESTIDNMLSIY